MESSKSLWSYDIDVEREVGKYLDLYYYSKVYNGIINSDIF